MIPALFDTAIFVYAVGGAHPYRSACRTLVGQAGRGEVRGHVTADLLQEFVFQRVRRTGDRATAVQRARDILSACTVLDVTLSDARLALDLYERHPSLDPRDAVFAAVALERGIRHVLSPDRAFDAVPGLVRVDPLDAGAVEALTA